MIAEVPAGPREVSRLKEPSLTIQAVPSTLPSTRARQPSEGGWYQSNRIVGSSTVMYNLSERESHTDISSKSERLLLEG